MSQQTPASTPLRSLLFHMLDIEFIARPIDWNAEEHTFTSDTHSLFLFTKGMGSLHIDDSTCHFTADKCYMISPGRSLLIENEYGTAISFYRITFSAIQIGENQHVSYIGNILSDRYEMTAYPFSRLIRQTEELYASRQISCDIDSFKQHIRFQELLAFLIEHNLHSDHSFNSTQSVESTVQYIQNNYTHNITVKKLAHLANVSYWQYTPIFQELTGKKPLDYLTELRINRSKELLIHSNDTLREIAHRVGFSDEYYFNRRFRQTTGVTPKQYARYMRNKTQVRDWTGHDVEIPAQPKRIIYYGETFGDLIALGVEVVGGGVTCLDHSLLKDRVKDVQDIGHPINPERLMALKPDLIIFACADERQYNRISKIAPTVTFNSFAPLDQRLLTLGHMLGRKQEADKWLDIFNAKADVTWKQLQSAIVPGETASVFIYDHGNRLFVMGTSGFSSALYHPFGFQPVDKIQEVLDAGEGFIEIPAAGLPAYAGDRIFMLVPERDDSRKAMEEMMSSSLWHSLPAVQNDRVYVIEAEKWNFGDALTREKLLDVLPDLLVSV